MQTIIGGPLGYPAIVQSTSGTRQVIIGGAINDSGPPAAGISITGNSVAIPSRSVGSPSIEVELTGQIISAISGIVGMSTSPSVTLTGNRVVAKIGHIVPPPVFFPELWATTPRYRSKTIPSYLYIQYNDDDDLQAFVSAYNSMAQEYVDWFAEINLPVYTGLVGTLLDWVAQGIYGQTRPRLPSGRNSSLGPLNTYPFNVLPFNGRKTISPVEFYATTDDVFKRIITWNFFKGDGRIFNIRWLKRRIMRFLVGENGINYDVDNTYQVSIVFGGHPQVNILILNGMRSVTGGAIPNRLAFNTKRFNQLDTNFIAFAPLTYAPILQAAINSGAVQLPFQYTWVVTIKGGS